MPVSLKDIDNELIKKISPFNTFSISRIEEILNRSNLQKIPSDKALFKAGEMNKWSIFLVEGEIELIDNENKKTIVKAGDDTALKEIAKDNPKKFSSIAKSQIKLLIIDTQMLRAYINSDSRDSITVSDFGSEEEEGDWMSTFLQTGIFSRLPPTNMMSMMTKLSEVELSKGKIVIKEGDTEDQNYYIIKQGKCIVSRVDPKTGKAKPLALIKAGSGFGEEALITEIPRGATVSMGENGVIQRLPKEDFIELLVKPVIELRTQEQIETMQNEGVDVTYIDVRSKEEHQANGIENSLHCSLRDIRDLFPKLDEEACYVVYSNSDHRASSAAFLLIQKNFNAYILKGGVGKPEGADATTSKSTAQEDTPEKDIEYYKAQLEKSEKARKNAETLVVKLKKELIKTKEYALKEKKVAQNALLKLKALEGK